MNDIIEIHKEIIGTEETNAVNARELHKTLESKRKYSDWIKDQIKNLGFAENIDYITMSQKCDIANGGHKMVKEYILTLNAAKHIAMASRTERGKQVRAYFIEVEKRYRSGQYAASADAPLMQAVLTSLQNIGEVVQALGMQMERLDRRLQLYEEREIYKREKARLRAQRAATGNGMIAAAYEGRRAQFIKLIQGILEHTETPLNQSNLLIKAGYRRDDKTARKWLGEGLGIYWRVEPVRGALIYSLIKLESAA